jgi:hypothetical protein
MKDLNDLATLPDWFDEPVSCFETVRSVEPVTVTIARWIQSIVNPKTEAELNRKKLVLEYRASGDKELKMKIPAFCPGALLKSRKASLSTEERIDKLTGWMQFDIDAKDNPHIESAEQLRHALSKNTYTAFCSLSTSGKGVWGLVKVKDVTDYKQCFEQLKRDYAYFGVNLDPSKGGNPLDLRYYTYDPDAYIASELRLYDRKVTSVKTARKKKSLDLSGDGDNWKKVSKTIAEINQRGLDIAPDYETYMKLAFSIANEFGEAGRDLFHAACQPNPTYKPKDADHQYSACLRSGGAGITIGTFFYMYKEALPD